MKKEKQFFVWGVYPEDAFGRREFTMDCVMAVSPEMAERLVETARRDARWLSTECHEAWEYLKSIAELASEDPDIVREEWEITKKNLA